MCDVEKLDLREFPWVDRERVEAMVSLLGDAAAERALNLTLDELGEALAEIDAAWRVRDVHRVVLCAATLVEMSADIGMSGLAAVASDVCATGRAGDAAGFSATVARLTRLIEASLRAACEPYDLIG
jgi:hypothetical protein